MSPHHKLQPLDAEKKMLLADRRARLLFGITRGLVIPHLHHKLCWHVTQGVYCIYVAWRRPHGAFLWALWMLYVLWPFMSRGLTSLSQGTAFHPSFCRYSIFCGAAGLLCFPPFQLWSCTLKEQKKAKPHPTLLYLSSVFGCIVPKEGGDEWRPPLKLLPSDHTQVYTSIREN